MGYKALTTDLASLAISAVGDLATSVTYSTIVTGAYDPTSDEVTTTTTIRTFNAVFARFTFNEVKGDAEIVVDTDAKLIVAAQDFGTGKPAKNDELVVDEEVWNVIKGKGVPGESVWIIHIRRT